MKLCHRGVSLHMCVTYFLKSAFTLPPSHPFFFPNQLQPSMRACPTPAPTAAAAPRPVRATSASVHLAGAARPATSVSGTFEPRHVKCSLLVKIVGFFSYVCVCFSFFFPAPHLIPLAAQMWTTALQTPAITEAPARTRLMVTSVFVLRSGQGKHA